MYHLYKLYGDTDYEKRKRAEFAKEDHYLVANVSSLVTLSPGFFRNELEIGLNVLGMDLEASWSDMMAFDALVLNPMVDLLHEYAELDSVGARLEAEEMKDVLQNVDAADAEDFPERQIEIIERAAGIS